MLRYVPYRTAGDPTLRDQRFHISRRYLTDPWAKVTTERLAEPGDILILGSGLTGLDLLLSLAKHRREGVIHLISRRGLFPRPHASCSPWPSKNIWKLAAASPVTVAVFKAVDACGERPILDLSFHLRWSVDALLRRQMKFISRETSGGCSHS